MAVPAATCLARCKCASQGADWTRISDLTRQANMPLVARSCRVSAHCVFDVVHCWCGGRPPRSRGALGPCPCGRGRTAGHRHTRGCGAPARPTRGRDGTACPARSGRAATRTSNRDSSQGARTSAIGARKGSGCPTTPSRGRVRPWTLGVDPAAASAGGNTIRSCRCACAFADECDLLRSQVHTLDVLSELAAEGSR